MKILIIKFLKFVEDNKLPAYEQKLTEYLKFSGAFQIHVSKQVDEAINVRRAHDSFFKLESSQHSHTFICEWIEPEELNP